VANIGGLKIRRCNVVTDSKLQLVLALKDKHYPLIATELIKEYPILPDFIRFDTGIV
jgi:hypothetical protein